MTKKAGQEPKFISQLHTVRKRIKGVKINSSKLRQKAEEKATFWGHHVSVTTIICNLHEHQLFGGQLEKKRRISWITLLNNIYIFFKYAVLSSRAFILYLKAVSLLPPVF